MAERETTSERGSLIAFRVEKRRLRRSWLRLAVHRGWTPLQARFLCRAAEVPGSPQCNWLPGFHPFRSKA